jgi:hypothetical protein
MAVLRLAGRAWSGVLSCGGNETLATSLHNQSYCLESENTLLFIISRTIIFTSIVVVNT